MDGTRYVLHDSGHQHGYHRAPIAVFRCFFLKHSCIWCSRCSVRLPYLFSVGGMPSPVPTYVGRVGMECCKTEHANPS